MSSEWLDDLTNGKWACGDEITVGFYCPYTNASECALSAKGRKPQEICEAIECDQLRLHQHSKRKNKAT